MLRLTPRRIASAIGTPRLSIIMSALFVCLSIPILIFILAYNYFKNAETIAATLEQSVTNTIQVSIESAENFIHPVGGMLRLLAETAAVDPGYFRNDHSADLLFAALTSGDQIDAVYVSFEDGYHRVVTRMDEDRRRSDPKIPVNANWHSSYIDDFSFGKDRARHRTFFETWGQKVGGYSVPSNLDIRVLDGYAEARATRGLVITEPVINPDTGAPILSVRYPIVHAGKFAGAASVNITMDVLSRYLAKHRASPNSASMIVDLNSGKIIAAADRRHGVQMIDGKLTVATIEGLADANVRKADITRTITGQSKFLFISPKSGDEISAVFTKFPTNSGKPWEIVVLTPTSDFIGSLEATNRQMALVIAVLILVELILIYALSTRLSRPIESISRELESVESLSFEDRKVKNSKIREIAQLQSAAALLRSSLQSFSSFVPLDVVRELVRTGTPLTLGVEQRFMTILFSDIEGFSTHAEQMAPADLLEKMSVYFEQVTRAVSQEFGTVDKFIGDGVMAFWGAPVERADHALRGCYAALRAIRRMQNVNEAWVSQGRRPLRIRIGLHSADVLVGNVGSAERLSYTVMGDGVNIASRLEGLNKAFGTTICISDNVLNAAGENLLVRPLRRVQVKGRTHELMTYELFGVDGSDDPELEVRADDARLSEASWQAWRYFEQGNVALAAGAYRAILADVPGDPVAKSMLDLCEEPSPHSKESNSVSIS